MRNRQKTIASLIGDMSIHRNLVGLLIGCIHAAGAKEQSLLELNRVCLTIY